MPSMLDLLRQLEARGPRQGPPLREMDEWRDSYEAEHQARTTDKVPGEEREVEKLANRLWSETFLTSFGRAPTQEEWVGHWERYSNGQDPQWDAYLKQAEQMLGDESGQKEAEAEAFARGNSSGGRRVPRADGSDWVDYGSDWVDYGSGGAQGTQGTQGGQGRTVDGRPVLDPPEGYPYHLPIIAPRDPGYSPRYDDPRIESGGSYGGELPTKGNVPRPKPVQGTAYDSMIPLPRQPVAPVRPARQAIRPTAPQQSESGGYYDPRLGTYVTTGGGKGGGKGGGPKGGGSGTADLEYRRQLQQYQADVAAWQRYNADLAEYQKDLAVYQKALAERGQRPARTPESFATPTADLTNPTRVGQVPPRPQPTASAPPPPSRGRVPRAAAAYQEEPQSFNRPLPEFFENYDAGPPDKRVGAMLAKNKLQMSEQDKGVGRAGYLPEPPPGMTWLPAVQVGGNVLARQLAERFPERFVYYEDDQGNGWQARPNDEARRALSLSSQTVEPIAGTLDSAAMLLGGAEEGESAAGRALRARGGAETLRAMPAPDYYVEEGDTQRAPRAGEAGYLEYLKNEALPSVAGNVVSQLPLAGLSGVTGHLPTALIGAVTGVAQMYAPAYREAVQDGASPDEAIDYAMVAGLGGGLAEVIGLDQARHFLRGGVGRSLLRNIFVGEGSEEVLQQGLAEGAATRYLGEDSQLRENVEDRGLRETVADYGETYGLGALAGAGFGAVGRGARAIDRSQRRPAGLDATVEGEETPEVPEVSAAASPAAGTRRVADMTETELVDLIRTTVQGQAAPAASTETVTGAVPETPAAQKPTPRALDARQKGGVLMRASEEVLGPGRYTEWRDLYDRVTRGERDSFTPQEERVYDAVWTRAHELEPTMDVTEAEDFALQEEFRTTSRERDVREGPRQRSVTRTPAGEGPAGPTERTDVTVERGNEPLQATMEVESPYEDPGEMDATWQRRALELRAELRELRADLRSARTEEEQQRIRIRIRRLEQLLTGAQRGERVTTTSEAPRRTNDYQVEMDEEDGTTRRVPVDAERSIFQIPGEGGGRAPTPRRSYTQDRFETNERAPVGPQESIFSRPTRDRQPIVRTQSTLEIPAAVEAVAEEMIGEANPQKIAEVINEAVKPATAKTTQRRSTPRQRKAKEEKVTQAAQRAVEETANGNNQQAEAALEEAKSAAEELAAEGVEVEVTHDATTNRVKARTRKAAAGAGAGARPEPEAPAPQAPVEAAPEPVATLPEDLQVEWSKDGSGWVDMPGEYEHPVDFEQFLETAGYEIVNEAEMGGVVSYRIRPRNQKSPQRDLPADSVGAQRRAERGALEAFDAPFQPYQPQNWEGRLSKLDELDENLKVDGLITLLREHYEDAPNDNVMVYVPTGSRRQADKDKINVYRYDARGGGLVQVNTATGGASRAKGLKGLVERLRDGGYIKNESTGEVYAGQERAEVYDKIDRKRILSQEEREEREMNYIISRESAAVERAEAERSQRQKIKQDPEYEENWAVFDEDEDTGEQPDVPLEEESDEPVNPYVGPQHAIVRGKTFTVNKRPLEKDFTIEPVAAVEQEDGSHILTVLITDNDGALEPFTVEARMPMERDLQTTLDIAFKTALLDPEMREKVKVLPPARPEDAPPDQIPFPQSRRNFIPDPEKEPDESFKLDPKLFDMRAAARQWYTLEEDGAITLDEIAERTGLDGAEGRQELQALVREMSKENLLYSDGAGGFATADAHAIEMALQLREAGHSLRDLDALQKWAAQDYARIETGGKRADLDDVSSGGVRTPRTSTSTPQAAPTLTGAEARALTRGGATSIKTVGRGGNIEIGTFAFPTDQRKHELAEQELLREGWQNPEIKRVRDRWVATARRDLRSLPATLPGEENTEVLSGPDAELGKIHTTVIRPFENSDSWPSLENEDIGDLIEEWRAFAKRSYQEMSKEEDARYEAVVGEIRSRGIDPRAYVEREEGGSDSPSPFAATAPRGMIGGEKKASTPSRLRTARYDVDAKTHPLIELITKGLGKKAPGQWLTYIRKMKPEEELEYPYLGFAQRRADSSGTPVEGSATAVAYREGERNRRPVVAHEIGHAIWNALDAKQHKALIRHYKKSADWQDTLERYFEKGPLNYKDVPDERVGSEIFAGNVFAYLAEHSESEFAGNAADFLVDYPMTHDLQRPPTGPARALLDKVFQTEDGVAHPLVKQYDAGSAILDSLKALQGRVAPEVTQETLRGYGLQVVKTGGRATRKAYRAPFTAATKGVKAAGTALDVGGKVTTAGVGALLAYAISSADDEDDLIYYSDETGEFGGAAVEALQRGMEKLPDVRANLRHNTVSTFLNGVEQPAYYAEVAAGLGTTALVANGEVSEQELADLTDSSLEGATWLQTTAQANKSEWEERALFEVQRIFWSGPDAMRAAYEELVARPDLSEEEITAILRANQDETREFALRMVVDPLALVNLGTAVAGASGLVGRPVRNLHQAAEWKELQRMMRVARQGRFGQMLGGAQDFFDSRTWWRLPETKVARDVRAAAMQLDGRIMSAESVEDVQAALNKILTGKLEGARGVDYFASKKNMWGTQKINQNFFLQLDKPGDVREAQNLARAIVLDAVTHAAQQKYGRSSGVVRGALAVSRLQKQALSALLLRWNPGYHGTNIAGNIGTAIADGYLAVASPRGNNVVSWWDDVVGYRPMIMEESFEATGRQLSGAVRAGTLETGGGRLFNPELTASRQVYTAAFQHWFPVVWNRQARSLARQHKLDEEFVGMVSGLWSDRDLQRALDEYGSLHGPVSSEVREAALDLMQRSRVGALAAADEARGFTLLHYWDKNYADVAFELMFPFYYWGTRSWMNWSQRILDNPAILSRFARTERAIYDAALAGDPGPVREPNYDQERVREAGGVPANTDPFDRGIGFTKDQIGEIKGNVNAGYSQIAGALNEALVMHDLLEEGDWTVNDELLGDWITGQMDDGERLWLNPLKKFVPVHDIFSLLPGSEYQTYIPEDEQTMLGKLLVGMERFPAAASPALTGLFGVADWFSRSSGGEGLLPEGYFDPELPIAPARAVRAGSALHRDTINSWLETAGVEHRVPAAGWNITRPGLSRRGYEEDRAAKMLSDMVEAGELTQQEADLALTLREGEAYDAVINKVSRYYGDRALLSFFTSVAGTTEPNWEMRELAGEYSDLPEGSDERDQMREAHPGLETYWRQYGPYGDLRPNAAAGYTADTSDYARELAGAGDEELADIINRTRYFDAANPLSREEKMRAFEGVYAITEDDPDELKRQAFDQWVDTEKERLWPGYRDVQDEYFNLRDAGQKDAANDLARARGLFDMWDWENAQVESSGLFPRAAEAWPSRFGAEAVERRNSFNNRGNSGGGGRRSSSGGGRSSTWGQPTASQIEYATFLGADPAWLESATYDDVDAWIDANENNLRDNTRERAARVGANVEGLGNDEAWDAIEAREAQIAAENGLDYEVIQWVAEQKRNNIFVEDEALFQQYQDFNEIIYRDENLLELYHNMR